MTVSAPSAPPANTLAATLEIIYLRPVLESLPAELKKALDVGAHKGDVTGALAELGFKVLAVEPSDETADRFARRHAERMSRGEVRLARCAASDRAGQADLLIGSASTVSTLEPQWTSIAFPEEFRTPRSRRVPLLPLATLLDEQDFAPVGFAKIDVEGHELQALRGLFGPNVAPPPVVMFEANQRFATQALDCLEFLDQHGYHTFDIFIRVGIDPVAGQRFSGEELPAAWHACGDRYFYANIIAYHSSHSDTLPLPDPREFIRNFQLTRARDLLRDALRDEWQNPIPVHPIWQDARRRLRKYLLEQDWRDFLRHPDAKHMFVRGRWGAAQDVELASLQTSSFGRQLLANLRDPDIGHPRFCDQLPGISTNLLGMAWYLTRIHQLCNGELPTQVIEVGGGYGAQAYAYLKTQPDAQYVIVDLPEMLAIQHYFLTLALPKHSIVFAGDALPDPRPGQITLVPVTEFEKRELHCDLLVSTFAMSEMPRELQRRIEQTGYFAAQRLFLTGQLSSEFPGLDLVTHGEVVGAAMQRFQAVNVERFHVGQNYVLAGSGRVA